MKKVSIMIPCYNEEENVREIAVAVENVIKEQLKEYFHTPNKARVFCQNCASPIYSYRTDLPNIIRLRMGTITEGHIPAPFEEFFCEHKPNFIELR